MIRTSFFETLSSCISKVILWFDDVIKDWPNNCPTQCCLQILGSATVLKSHIIHFKRMFCQSTSLQLQTIIHTTLKNLEDFINQTEEYLFQIYSDEFICSIFD